MDSVRANEIVSALNDRCFYTMGLCENPRSLAGVTLAQMLEAKGIVEAENDAAVPVDGQRTVKMVPDDRLIAAAYCVEHYPVANEAIVIMPTTRREGFWHESDRKALALVPLTAAAYAGEDEDA